jgi:hypothetical protein
MPASSDRRGHLLFCVAFVLRRRHRTALTFFPAKFVLRHFFPGDFPRRFFLAIPFANGNIGKIHHVRSGTRFALRVNMG